MKLCHFTKPERFILKGILWLFIIGSVMHFIYQFSGEHPIVGWFAPTNESVWEHLKMVVLPIILWWGLFYAFNKNKYKIDENAWFTGAIASLFTTLLLIPFLFYFYTNAFGVELVWVDILILLIALIVGQSIGLHVYRYSKGISSKIVILIMILIVAVFIIFTKMPPNLPIFQSSV